MKPPELERAELIDGLARRYGVLPSAIEREDASLLRMLTVLQMGTPDQGGAP